MSKTNVASRETRWITGGPYTGPAYASFGVISTLRSTRVTASSPVVCRRPSGVRTTLLEWKHTSVWLERFSSQWLRNFQASSMEGAVDGAGQMLKSTLADVGFSLFGFTFPVMLAKPIVTFNFVFP